MKKHKILIVEDNQDFVDVLKIAMGDEEFEPTVCLDGKTGLKEARNGGYDLILLDVILPGMTGVEVLRSLRKHPPKVKNGPILVLTNLTGGSELEEAKNLGMIEYVDKTKYNPGQLVDLIKQKVPK